MLFGLINSKKAQIALFGHVEREIISKRLKGKANQQLITFCEFGLNGHFLKSNFWHVVIVPETAQYTHTYTKCDSNHVSSLCSFIIKQILFDIDIFLESLKWSRPTKYKNWPKN